MLPAEPLPVAAPVEPLVDPVEPAVEPLVPAPDAPLDELLSRRPRISTSWPTWFFRSLVLPSRM